MFIRKGQVEVIAPGKVKPFMYLPTNAIFGYEFLMGEEKSKYLYRTVSSSDGADYDDEEPVELMCVNREVVENLMALYPQTAENIKLLAAEKNIVN